MNKTSLILIRAVLTAIFLTTLILACNTTEDSTTINPKTEEKPPIAKETFTGIAQTIDINPDSTIKIRNLGTANSFYVYLSAQKKAAGIPVKISFTGDDPIKNIEKSYTSTDNSFVIILKNSNFGYKITRQDGKPFFIDENTNTTYTEFHINTLIIQTIYVKQSNETLGNKNYQLWTNNNFLSNLTLIEVSTAISNKEVTDKVTANSVVYKLIR